MTDEPLVVPLSPGSALVRLSQVLGGLNRHESIRRSLPPATLDDLGQARAQLTGALEAGDNAAIAQAYKTAQDTLRELYDAMNQPGLWDNVEIPEGQGDAFSLLGYPTPVAKNFEGNVVAAVDVDTVLTTFSKPQRQVFTSICFNEAANSIGYWLIEVRTLNDETYEEHILDSFLPCFRRVRLPIGTHTFKIQSRDHSHTKTSEPFTIVVPAI